jgi:hypothetical protein
MDAKSVPKSTIFQLISVWKNALRISIKTGSNIFLKSSLQPVKVQMQTSNRLQLHRKGLLRASLQEKPKKKDNPTLMFVTFVLKKIANATIFRKDTK